MIFAIKSVLLHLEGKDYRTLVNLGPESKHTGNSSLKNLTGLFSDHCATKKNISFPVHPDVRNFSISVFIDWFG